jgi:tetratricopeptide (TPR) repeat protein
MPIKRVLAAAALILACTISTVHADVYEDALKHYRAGRFAAAIQVLEKKASRSSGENDLLGWSYLQAGRIDEAKRSFTAALALEPSLADAHCGMGYALFRNGENDSARAAFDRGIAASPTHVDCLLGKGLLLRRIGDNTGAVEWFDKALAIDRTNATAIEEKRKILGAKVEAEHAGSVAQALGVYRRNELQQALPLLTQLATDLPDNADIQLALADTRYRTGDNLGAARIYRSLIQRNLAVDVAIQRFLELYGLNAYDASFPLEPVARPRPATRRVDYRTHGDYFEYFDGKAWQKTYLMGVNIGPARPNEFASTPSKEVKVYLEWLDQIASMNSNMVRIYTILPPAFYHAFRIHNLRAKKPLWLLHEVWLRESDEKNLYDADWSDEFEREIRNVVDIIHGQANVAYRRGHASGIYTADVSQWTFAIGPGREVEPSIVLVTNRKNPSQTSFEGTYVRVKKGNPAEVWFAKMIELTARYEMDRYNSQRPLTIINWPPLDPMHHVTEASFAEELEVQRKRGENIGTVAPDLLDDADVAVVDVMNLQATPQFPAGLFASFHVYTYWPDFLPYDPEYPKVRDAQGSNRYYGYLLDLKKHHPGMPVLVAEYGVPTSWGIAHVHPDGWHNGGFSEQAQADLLTRMSRNIYDSGSAGGLVFAWIDEWWKCVADVATNPFDVPQSRRPLWSNMLNPEEHFGILGYLPSKRVPLLRGSDEDWRGATTLAEKPDGAIRRVRATSDSAYLYLRLDVAGPIDWKQQQYWVALNTLPGKAGVRRLPGGVEIESGANFILQLAGRDDANLRIASNYTPTQQVYSNVAASGKRPYTRESMSVGIIDIGTFEDMIVEANQPRFGRDGTVFPPINVNRSPLHFGTADPNVPGYSTLNGWRTEDAKGMIEVRIPWGLMYITDPSARNAMNGTDKQRRATWTETPGISVVAMALTPDSSAQRTTVIDSLPRGTDSAFAAKSIPIYTWQKWDEVQFTPYLKESYRALQKIFGTLDAEFAKR